MTKKYTKLFFITGSLAGLVFLLFYFLSINIFVIREASAANTISCSATPYLIDPGDNITISAVINFTASDIWAVIESENGVAQSHYVLNEDDATHYSRSYATSSTDEGQYDIGVYATVDGTGEQLLCNPSTGATWIKKTLSSMPWHSRFAHEVLSYGGYLWILGGYTNNYDNDVWRSRDGENWDLITSDAPWAGRKSFGSAVFDPDGAGATPEAMMIFGGDNYVGTTHTFYKDVWWSTNGKDWFKLAHDADWSAREYFATAVYDGKIWISGGYNGTYQDDLWYTSNPSVGWTEVTMASNVDFNTLAKHQMVAYDDGTGERLWILGGQNLDTPPNYSKNNIYKADNVAATSWTLQSTPPWIERYEFSAIVYDYPGDSVGAKILIMGGADNASNDHNDVWSYEPSQGWDLVTDPDPIDHHDIGSAPSSWTHWSSRFRLRTVVHNRGNGDELFLIGGRELVNRSWNDVWTTIDGANWDLIGDNYDGIFNTRWASSMAAYNDKLWILGAGNDIWSSPDGVTWEQPLTTKFCQSGTDLGDSCTQNSECVNADCQISAPWQKRWAHKTLLYNNKLWLIGGCKTGSGGGGVMCGGTCSDTGLGCTKGSDCGSSGTCVHAGLNDVWSTTNGTTWTQETANANFFGRYEFATAVFDDGGGEKMWILGGDVMGKCSSGTYINEICRVDDDCDGSTCSKVCVAGSSIGTTCSNDSTCGGSSGNCSFFALNDVLSSSDGITWNLKTAAGQWPTRSSFVSLGYNNKLWVMAGFHADTGVLSGYYLNDVWSSEDGTTWSLAKDHAAWNPRHTPALVEYRDKMWLYGGNNGFFSGQAWTRMDSNNVWWSTDGATWNQVTSWAEWDGRDFFSYTVFQDRMWLMGGDSMGTGNNDVWASRFSNLSYYVVQPVSGQVTVTAQVDPEISLTLPDGESCSLQAMTPDLVRTCGYSAVIATNAANGYSLYVRGNGGFQSGNNAISPESDDNLINGTGILTAENGEYGLSVKTNDSIDYFPAYTGDCIANYDDQTNDFPAKGLSDTNDHVISYYVLPTDGITHGVVDVCHGVRIKADTPAGSYSQIITITAINNF